MISIIIAGLAFTGGCLAIFAVNLVMVDLFQGDRKRMQLRLHEEMRERYRQEARESPLFKRDLSELAEEAFEETTSESKTMVERFRELAEQSGMRVTPQQLILVSGGVAFALAMITFTASRSAVSSLAVALLGGIIPIIYVQIKRQQRMELLRSQLPDCFDLMSRIIRAGQTMSQAMQGISDEFKAPAATEFGYCYDQQSLGLPPEVAYRELARRNDILEMKIFVLALLVHRQTGGNLTGLLDNLSNVVRQRYIMRGKIKGLTAEGRVQALILLALPILVFGALMIVNREYAMKLFDHPSLIITAIVMMGIGALWIRRIINFDF